MHHTCSFCGGRPAPIPGSYQNKLVATFKCNTCGRVYTQRKRQPNKTKPSFLNQTDLETIETAYTLLGDIFHKWPGRDTTAGQTLLCELRDLISRQTGICACEVSTGLNSPMVRNNIH